jgi:hypothetical protein
MADYSQADIGQWIKKQTAVGLDKSRSFSLVIDTINHRATTPTGRPIEDGWIFFRLNDHPDSAVLGDRDLILRFRYRMAASEVIPKSESNGMTSGNRFISGFSVDWNEPSPRPNTSHFLEINLHKTLDYHQGQVRGCPFSSLDGAIHASGALSSRNEIFSARWLEDVTRIFLESWHERCFTRNEPPMLGSINQLSSQRVRERNPHETRSNQTIF